jgi:hypothetical protein
MNASNFWLLRVEAYLVQRHSLGYKLTIDETVLKGFARFADTMGDQYCLTMALAMQWAQDSKRDHPITRARRIEVLRGFARFCQRLDPFTEIPPSGLFGQAHRRLIPHIYTEVELIALLNATDNLISRHGLRPATCRTIFGLRPQADCAFQKRPGFLVAMLILMLEYFVFMKLSFSRVAGCHCIRAPLIR